jgi:hypothetical protein
MRAPPHAHAQSFVRAVRTDVAMLARFYEMNLNSVRNTEGMSDDIHYESRAHNIDYSSILLTLFFVVDFFGMKSHGCHETFG